MTTLAEQIRARLIELGDEGVNGTEAELAAGAAAEISALSAAVDAVLDVHQPNQLGNCANRCYTSGIAPAQYPCLTVLAIAAALGVAGGAS